MTGVKAKECPERPFRPPGVSFVGPSFRPCRPSVTRPRLSDQLPSGGLSGLRPAGSPALRRRTACDFPPETSPACAFLVFRPSAAGPPLVSPVPRLSGFPYSAGLFAPFGVAYRISRGKLYYTTSGTGVNSQNRNFGRRVALCPGQRLLQVLQDVPDVLDPHGQPDEVLGHAGLLLLPRRELLVGGRRGMDLGGRALPGCQKGQRGGLPLTHRG